VTEAHRPNSASITKHTLWETITSAARSHRSEDTATARFTRKTKLDLIAKKTTMRYADLGTKQKGNGPTERNILQMTAKRQFWQGARSTAPQSPGFLVTVLRRQHTKQTRRKGRRP